MNHKLGRKTACLVAVAATALLLAACGSSSSSSSSASSSSGSASTAAASTSSGSSTITVGSAISVNSPILNDGERKAGIEAAISDINAAGGVNGHQLKFDFCDTEYSANMEIDCARQMV